jgi:hypothetical protein
LTSSLNVSFSDNLDVNNHIRSSKNVLDSRGFSQDSTPSDASTIRLVEAAIDISPPDLATPNLIKHVKVLAQTKALSAISDMIFAPSFLKNC